MEFFETHAHLVMKEYETYSWWYDKTIDEIIENAKNNNVTKIVDVRCGLKDIFDLEIQRNPEIYYAIGLHPNDTVRDYNQHYKDKFIDIAKEDYVYAIGEVGIDLHYDTPLEIQVDSLLWHTKLANEINKPLILHIRDAYDEFFDVVDANKELFLNNKFVLHCFAGTKEHANLAQKYGFYLGIGGTITFKNNKILPDIVTTYPQQLIVLETDCPFLTPHPFRGQKNEPANIIYVNDFIANLWEITPQEAAKITYDNAIFLFNIKK